ncbi:hypothetical protein M5K25_012739 [Dendrobium thyrsiflorum]|uniref:Uncharacterized protein n=1 Tax=Dendrobium thyrsiflorum TaxID=117978 RepID=A0ABD0UYN0_DENTH
MPNSFNFLNPPTLAAAAHRRATWWTMLAPALSPARKQDEGSERWPAAVWMPPESMKWRTSAPSS